MAKKVKLPLDMGNERVRTLDELKENFNIEKIVEHFGSGMLLTWLEDRYYNEEAEKVRELQELNEQGNIDNLPLKLGEIFGQEIDEDIDIDVDSIDSKRQRVDMLRKVTGDKYIITHPELVAFNQEELDELVENEEKIYIYGEKFDIDLEYEDMTYICLGKTCIDFIGELDWENFDSDNDSISFGSIKVVNCNFSEEMLMKYNRFIASIEICGDETENKIVSIVHEAYGFKSLFEKNYE